MRGRRHPHGSNIPVPAGLVPSVLSPQAMEIKMDYRQSMDQWPFTYVYNFPVPLATGSVRHKPFPITDKDFVVRGWMADTSASLTDFLGVGPFTSKQFSIALSRPDESLIHSQQIVMGLAAISAWQNTVPQVLAQGTAQFPLPFKPEMYLKEQSSLYVDITNLDTADIMVQVAIQGVKLFPKGRFYSPAPGIYYLLPFDYHFRLQSIAGGLITATTFSNVTLEIDADADFCMLAVDAGDLSGLTIKMYGPTREEPMSNDMISLSNFCGSSRFPAPLLAPAFWPASGQIKFDFRIPTGLAVASIDNPSYITFKGYKMYRSGPSVR